MFPFFWILIDPCPCAPICRHVALSQEDRHEADQLARLYARLRYSKELDQLSRTESDSVQALVKAYFAR